MIKNWKYFLAAAASFTFSTAFSQTVKDAQRSADLEKTNEAMKTLRQLNKASANEETALFLGDAYLRAGKADSASIYYNQAAAANAKSAVAMVAAGKAALVKGNTAEAEAKFEAAIKASKKKDANIYLLIGQAYVDTKAKDNAKAIEYLTTANTLSKNNNADVYIALGDAHLLNPNGGGPAMTAYDQAVRIDQKNAKAHVRRGQLFVRSRNYNEAQQALQAALAADPNFAPAYRELGEMYYFVGKYDQSLENYKKYISMSEDSPETRAKYASFLFLTKDYAGTTREAQTVLAKDPNNAVMNRLLAFSLYETNQNDQALAAIERYFKNAKQEQIIASDYAYYGRVLAKAGKNDLAQQNFDKALQMDPENIELHDDVAAFYVKQKDFAKAIPVYSKIIASKPKNLNVYNVKLADAYFAAKKLESADSLYSVVLKTNPDYAHGLFRRAQIQDEKDTDKSGDAKPYFEEFVKKVAQDPSKAESYKGYLIPANYLLGFYAYKAKDYSTAKKYWEEVKRLDPSNKEATTGLNNIEVTTKTKAKR
jgi:tetratricopeptide (TPR) repeat protein